MDQRRVVLAFILSLGVVLLFQEFVVRPRQHPSGAPSAPSSTTVPAAPSGTATVTPGSGAVPGDLSYSPGDAAPVVVETDVWRATITPRGGRLTSLALKEFRQSVKPESPLLDLVEHGPLLPLTVTVGTESDASVPYAPSTQTLDVHGDSVAELVLTGTLSGRRIEKRLRFPGNAYIFDVDVSTTGTSSVGMVLPALEKEGLVGGSSSGRSVAVILANGKILEHDLTKLDAAGIAAMKADAAAGSQWGGFSMPFFLGAIVAANPAGGTATVEHAGSRPIIRMEEPLTDGRASFKVFMGPKSKEVLEASGYELARALDFGWFWFIALPMLQALRLLHRLTGNYGVDIILLTGLVRALTIPLTQKSYRSMKEMQKLQPQLKRLQQQYKDDQTRLQKEMMELYQRNKVNPFSGCAPMLLQMPIFLGLYNALLHAIELRHAPFALWITDLSAPERLTVAGVGIPVLTILMGATMVLQQWLTPAQGDPTQRQMMMVMPLVFTFMFINFPSGLVLYWLVSNILGIAQQWAMLRT